MRKSETVKLTRFAWLSISAAILTIALKMGAFLLTDSIGLLSDALESLVNLVTAIVALIALTMAARPEDEEFTFGYSKVEFFSTGFEGGMILIAAGSIIASAIPRLIHPQPIEQVGLGVLVSAFASLINLVVSRILAFTGQRYGSITLQADAKHLMTDVITTGGVLVGIGLVSLTDWQRLDPLIALFVAANILFTGIKLIRQAGRGLLDASLPAAEVQLIRETLEKYREQGVEFHALRTRSAAARGFVSMHILVPGEWSVQHSHDFAEQIEDALRQRIPKIAVFTHLEPIDDPASMDDSNLDRE